jgi:hypothetical protein
MTEFCALADAGGRDSMEHADYPRWIAPGAHCAWEMPFPLEGLPDVPEEFRRHLPD